ncbi:flagellar basal-body rod protein FlgG [Candidatus Dependentiae bacterium]|nr:flagellar basal-body rod protein FlgG [Candidatus Dependentiae bacterium]
MMLSLWTSASGMNAQQFNVDVISNNMANVNTTGFKRDRVDFADLMYQKLVVPGTPAGQGSVIPTGTQVGLGSRVTATQKTYTQGSVRRTENPMDMAIEGDGFFQILLPDGTIAYTRDGSFKLDGSKSIVTSDGYKLYPELSVPEDATSLSVSEDGVLSVMIAGQITPQEIGTLELVKFVNPAGLTNEGNNLVKETAASGAPVAGKPNENGIGRIRHGFLEMSNVIVVNEMVNLISAQRAYELNSKSIQTADTMLGIATNLKR